MASVDEKTPTLDGESDWRQMPEVRRPPKALGRDVEKGLVRRPTEEEILVHKSEAELLVTWNGPEDPQNPLNWPLSKKWAITLLMSGSGLVTLTCGAILAPALERVSEDLHSSAEGANMALSIFILAFAFGPMILAPATEVFGRRIVWLLCSVWYVIWNTVCGFARSQSLMLPARILAGLGGCVNFAVTNPVLGDCWPPEKRGLSFAIGTFVSLLGPAIGPIVSGFITDNVGWRWSFWVLSILDGVLIVVGFFIFDETYEQVILYRRALRLQRLTKRPYHCAWAIHSQPLGMKLKNSLTRPCRMILTQPTIQLLAVLLAFNFGVIYFVTVSFASIWIDRYNQSVAVSGLHYAAIIIGYTIAAQGGARITDRLWKYLKDRYGGRTSPEYRVPLMVPGVVLVPAGLLWYGWAVEAKAHWMVVDIGAAVYGCGIIVSSQAMQQYVIESYQGYVASANAASQFLRSVFGFCFPLFVPALYHRLGCGLGNTLLSLLFLTLAIPGPIILWFYGAKLRAKGRPLLQ